jgi:GNAT superfamily N-acetyltransferase
MLEIMMAIIRPILSDDVAALYGLSLATGHEGGDASHLYADPKMMGHIYSAPYAILEPSMCLVLADAKGVACFVAGATDTAAWEDRLEKEWWPQLRQRYSDPFEGAREAWSPDERRASMIHHPPKTPRSVIGPYPSHLHINHLPRAQGAGLGTRLFNEWRELIPGSGVKGIHVGVNSGNQRAKEFWTKRGFANLASKDVPQGRTVWMGLATGQCARGAQPSQ